MHLLDPDFLLLMLSQGLCFKVIFGLMQVNKEANALVRNWSGFKAMREDFELVGRFALNFDKIPDKNQGFILMELRA